MERKIIFTSLILLFLAVTLNGQTIYPEVQKVFDEHYYRLKTAEPIGFAYDGSPYLYDQFRTGDVIFDDGTIYKEMLLRYNVYYDLFEFSIKGHTYALDKSMKYSVFRIGDQTFVYQSYFYNSIKKEGYLEIIAKGNYSLYRIYNVRLKEAEMAKAYKDPTNAKFIYQKPDYLISKDDGKIVSIKNEKELLKKLDLSEPVKKYSGNKKIKLRNEKDYLQLIEFLNSL